MSATALVALAAPPSECRDEVVDALVLGPDADEQILETSYWTDTLLRGQSGKVRSRLGDKGRPGDGRRTHTLGEAILRGRRLPMRALSQLTHIGKGSCGGVIREVVDLGVQFVACRHGS